MTIKSTLRSEQLTLLSDYPAIRLSALPVLDQRLRGTTFVALAPRSILNSPQQTGVDFWSLNPYIGCEFGCTYCYARYAHRYAVERARDAGKLSEAEFHDFRGPHGWEAFERRIFVKERLLGALEADLGRYMRTARPPDGPTAPIVIGTATDPYQPAERRFRLTRQVVERLPRCATAFCRCSRRTFPIWSTATVVPTEEAGATRHATTRGRWRRASSGFRRDADFP